MALLQLPECIETTLFCADFVTASRNCLRFDQYLFVTSLGSHLPDLSSAFECRQGRSVQF